MSDAPCEREGYCKAAPNGKKKSGVESGDSTYRANGMYDIIALVLESQTD
jgi:hypothetical protein